MDAGKHGQVVEKESWVRSHYKGVVASALVIGAGAWFALRGEPLPMWFTAPIKNYAEDNLSPECYTLLYQGHHDLERQNISGVVAKALRITNADCEDSSPLTPYFDIGHVTQGDLKETVEVTDNLKITKFESIDGIPIFNNIVVNEVKTIGIANEMNENTVEPDDWFSFIGNPSDIVNPGPNIVDVQGYPKFDIETAPEGFRYFIVKADGTFEITDDKNIAKDPSNRLAVRGLHPIDLSQDFKKYGLTDQHLEAGKTFGPGYEALLEFQKEDMKMFVDAFYITKEGKLGIIQMNLALLMNYDLMQKILIPYLQNEGIPMMPFIPDLAYGPLQSNDGSESSKEFGRKVLASQSWVYVIYPKGNGKR